MGRALDVWVSPAIWKNRSFKKLGLEEQGRVFMSAVHKIPIPYNFSKYFKYEDPDENPGHEATR